MNKDIQSYCFLARKGKVCIKTKVDKKHLPYYECEKCIWHIHGESSREMQALERLFNKYGTVEWK